jgi:hypothetical protein
MAVKTAIINGTPYITPLNVNSGESLGNTSKLSYSIETEKKELPNYQGGGGNDDAFEKFKSGRVALSVRHVSLSALSLALGATSATVTGAAVADEPHTVETLGQLVALDNPQDLAQSLTVTPAAGGTAFVEGTDYIRKRSGIIPLADGSMTADLDIEVSYTKLGGVVFQALVKMITETGLLFDGVNERSGKPWVAKFHRVAWGASKNFEFIGDDFASFDIEGEILAADFITGVGLSQFLELKVGDL